MSVSTTSGALAERLVDLVTLVSLLAAAALTAYSGRLPQQGVEALVAGLGLAAVGLIGLLLLPRSHRLVHRFVPARWHSAYERFEHGAVRSLDRLPLLVCYSALGWLIEGASLGTASSAASAIALLNRLVNYASLAVAGAVLYLALRIMQLRVSPASGPAPF